MKLIATILLGFFLTSCAHKMNPQENYLMGILFTQKAAEHTALTLQAYNIAIERLDRVKKEYRGKKQLAVVLDVDETVLDNSPYQGKLYVQSEAFNYDNWKEWIAQKKAHPVAGALRFTKAAHKKGFKVFYLTNRSEKFKADTIENLRKVGFPQHYNSIFKSKERSKEGRRQSLAQKYHLALLVGDNLTDFSKLYDEQSTERRKEIVLKNHSKDFGKKFIVLPNTMYGDWDKALIDYKKLNESDKRCERTSQLTVF
ncbi:MAG: 5'-nucleotidase, lipoprotein e(P4) family [Oligoflexia bacterium]|nr:5'-nucleotidase, lipoprotein e(P4) family [Oligoflexia bacterium]